MSLKNDSNIKKYQEYFEEESTRLHKEYIKSEEYGKMIDEQIDKMKELMKLSNKGVTMTMVEQINNAISLQSQRQSLIKDMFNLKKAVLDYTVKNSDDGDSQSVLKAMREFIDTQKKDISSRGLTPIDNDELDARIDEALEDYNEEDA